jgi:hypothetical protein
MATTVGGYTREFYLTFVSLNINKKTTAKIRYNSVIFQFS